MNPQPPPTEVPTALRHVWSALPSDLQQHAVRLLTRLAFAHFRQQTHSPTQEIHYVHHTESEDPPRPS
jgi:hypothetical protein